MDLDRPIEVSYAGNFHTTWDGRTLELLPPPWSPLTPDHLIDDVVPHTKAESRVRFVRWIKKEIETVKESELVGGRQPNLDNRKSLRSLYGLLAIAQDRDAFPSCINPRIIRSFFKEANAQGDAILELSDVFDEFRGSLLNNVESLAEFSLTNNVSPSEDRTAADVGAQKEVKTWYDECCILTGCDSPGEPAHIIDVNKELKDGDLATYWKKLRSFYPSLARLDTLVVQGQENANILPFGVEPYRYFNKLNRLALRPISIQQTHRAYSCRANIMDYRRGYSQGSTVTAAVLQHGDVYKITTNASNYPLPKYEFLRIRYAAQCITAGMQTAGALSDIFCGPPPDVKGIKDAARKREMVPEEWDVLIEFAQREGVLSEEAAERWRLSIVEQYYIWTPPSSPMSSSNEEYT